MKAPQKLILGKVKKMANIETKLFEKTVQALNRLEEGNVNGIHLYTKTRMDAYNLKKYLTSYKVEVLKANAVNYMVIISKKEKK